MTWPSDSTHRPGLAVSNIAWPADAESNAEAARILLDGGATGVEVAPSLLPGYASGQQTVAEIRSRWEDLGLPVVALQALLFNRPHLQLFGSDAGRAALMAHLDSMAALAEGLGARVLVFGSPKNRLKGSLTETEALDQAVPFFRELGTRAEDRGVLFGMEANPAEYGCDWLTTLAEANALVAAVASPGIALHGDAGGLILSGHVPPGQPLDLVHHHASEPHLATLTDRPCHHALASWLQASHYRGWISIEMRQPPQTPESLSWQEALRSALAAAQRCYGLVIQAVPT